MTRYRIPLKVARAVAPLTEERVTAVAAAMRDFMVFHKATDLIIKRSAPTEYADRVLATL